ncbi:MAG: cytochrome c-type biogenesis protein CcmH [Bauldia sp.]|nr:cytochrome c-type biogenesis protein CcmH [Bauldia sp.]
MRRLLLGLAIVLAVVAVRPAFAVLPQEMLADPVLEARARALSAELRCMVCQNQSIDDSEAELAADLRVLVRERLAAGDSDAEVLDFLVARYGEFILLKPRFNWHTALLWAAPPAVLVIGGLIAFVAYGRRRRGAPAPLGPAEEEALRRLISEENGGSNITES